MMVRLSTTRRTVPRKKKVQLSGMPVPFVKPYKQVFTDPTCQEVLRTPKQGNVPDSKSLREELLGVFEREKHGLKHREISVMTRLSVDIVEIIDALVELEIFKSRSEAVAAFIERSIVAKKELFEAIRAQAKDIVSKREAAKHLAFQAIKSDNE